jgi:hypothetical protein
MALHFFMNLRAELFSFLRVVCALVDLVRLFPLTVRTAYELNHKTTKSEPRIICGKRSLGANGTIVRTFGFLWSELPRLIFRSPEAT